VPAISDLTQTAAFYDQTVMVLYYAWKLMNCFRWIPACASLFMENRDMWQHLIPPTDEASTELIQQFFTAVSSLMSLQLRGLVVSSLLDFLSFFHIHTVSWSCKSVVVIFIICVQLRKTTFKVRCMLGTSSSSVSHLGNKISV
jgi:hypothetical protein